MHRKKNNRCVQKNNEIKIAINSNEAFDNRPTVHDMLWELLIINYRSFVLLLIDHKMNVDLTLRRRPGPLLNVLIYILYPESLNNCSEKFREATRKTLAMEFFFRNVE